MNTDNFESLMLSIFLPGLFLFLAFIIYDLAKKTKAGKLGFLILFGVLFLGVLGFIIKLVLIELIM